MSTGLIAFLLYLLMMVDNFRDVAQGLLIISSIVMLILVIANIVNYTDRMRPLFATRAEKVSLALGIMLIVGSTSVLTFVPDRTTAVTIVAVVVGYETVTGIVEDNRVQALGGKTIDMLESWLDQQTLENKTKQPTTQGETDGNS